ncbi:MAG: RNA polymerase subunit sigma-24 [Candidatus Nephthysia bennettiae]|nr:MAG: RNA polymerase subunit sigma-24 [Candidatus Dormibacteraeota bacterium]
MFSGGVLLEALDPVSDFDAVYEQYRVRIYRTIYGVVLNEATAEDLTQETFERAYRTREEFRGSAPLGAWLHRIALNLSISHLRRQGRLRQLPFRLFTRPDTGKAFDRVDASTLTQRALAALRPKHRAVVVLHFYAGMTRDEIAVVLGVPEGTVASRLSAGLGVMRKALARAESELTAELSGGRER